LLVDLSTGDKNLEITTQKGRRLVVIKEAWKLLKPRGKFIFWEHGCSRNRLTSVAQGSTQNIAIFNATSYEHISVPQTTLVQVSICIVSKVGSNFIAHEYAIIVPTLVHAASGVVLEPGPGPGNLK
jgi:hypothetical protein